VSCLVFQYFFGSSWDTIHSIRLVHNT
jgi:hypothetical protein